MTSVALVLAICLHVWKWGQLWLSELNIFSKMLGLGVLLPSLKTPNTQS